MVYAILEVTKRDRGRQRTISCPESASSRSPGGGPYRTEFSAATGLVPTLQRSNRVTRSRPANVPSQQRVSDLQGYYRNYHHNFRVLGRTNP